MVLDKKRNVMNCYWETQPSGCLKPHCPFLHDKPKEEPPYEPETVAIVPRVVPSSPASGTIIVNKKKLDQMQIVLPGSHANFGSTRTVIPPKRSVKDRLGLRKVERVDVYECTDSEEEDLRMAAKRTIDLRSRLMKRKHAEEDNVEAYSDDSEVETKVRSVVVKKVKNRSFEKIPIFP